MAKLDDVQLVVVLPNLIGIYIYLKVEHMDITMVKLAKREF